MNPPNKFSKKSFRNFSENMSKIPQNSAKIQQKLHKNSTKTLQKLYKTLQNPTKHSAGNPEWRVCKVMLALAFLAWMLCILMRVCLCACAWSVHVCMCVVRVRSLCVCDPHILWCNMRHPLGFYCVTCNTLYFCCVWNERHQRCMCLSWKKPFP